MNASDLYKAGKLSDAIAAQTQEVKSHPGDKNRRLFLFELLVIAGDLDRARRQLDVLQYDEVELQRAVQFYHHLLDAEEKRRRLFREGLQPLFLEEPAGHVALRLGAVNFLRDGHPREARQLLDKANADAAYPRGQLNGKPFDLLRDTDDLFGTVLEVMAQGNYYWVPLEQVETITMNAPKTPRDLLWIPARLELKTSKGEVFLPALYPGSHEHADEQVKLGRQTDWKAADDGPVLGAGLHTFLAGDDAVGILDWRELQLES